MPATRSLTTKFTLSLLPEYLGTGDLNVARDRTEFKKTGTLATGTAANQANRYYALKIAFDASQAKTVNIKTADAGEDSLGQAIDLDEIKAIMIKNNGDEAFTIGGAASNPWLGLLDGADDLLNLPSGATIVALAPAAGGWPITTDVNLKITNTSASAGEIELIVVGVES